MNNKILDKKLIPVAVINDVNYALPLAEALLEGGLNVIEITLRTEAAMNCIEIIRKSNLKKIVGDKLVSGIELDTGQKIDVDGVFIEVGGIPLSGLAKNLGVEIDKKKQTIEVNEKMETNIDGVYAAGDISNGSDGFNQIITAAAEGAIAARSAFNYIRLLKNK